MKKILFLILSFFLFIGCSSKSTIVLIDNNKEHNAIVISNSEGSITLDKTGNYVDLKSQNRLPKKVKKMSQAEINERFKETLEAEPLPPEQFIVYFKKNSTELIDESKNVLEKAMKSIKKRRPCLVDIVGHTDTVGSEEKNMKVSLKRAKYIQAILLKNKINPQILTVKGYGEIELMVATADNVSEEKNRNVEIFVK
jgi:outer membrane protein OmpA-like peptidoglycan-associated protein